MDGAAADLQEWELLLASPTGGAAVPGPYAGGGGEGHDNDVHAGAIKYDYFDLGSDARYTRRASLSIGGEEETDEEEGALLDASGNASWVEPQPDDLAFPGRDRAALWSDSSSDGERREEAEATEPLEPPPQEEAAAADEGAVAKGGAAPWWKLPMEVLRFWAARAARSAWSLPVAVALLGIAVLGRRLYRMRRQSKAVARFRLVLDEKKASQFKAQPMLRRSPLVKPLLPANGVTPWPVLGHL